MEIFIECLSKSKEKQQYLSKLHQVYTQYLNKNSHFKI